MATAVGIDLGTSKSLVAAVVNGKPVVIPSRDGSSTPSVVCIPRHGEVLVGAAAVRAASRYPDRTFWSFKDLLGAVERRVVVEGHHLLPEDLATHVITRLKEDAEATLGTPVTEAVVTVPAGAGYRQRQATRTAVENAGVRVLRMLREPTAAAVAYHALRGTEETVIVVDLGGGTLDVAILEVGQGVVEVKSTASDLRLGGDNFDLNIVDRIVDRFRLDHDIDLSADAAALVRIKAAAEQAKIDLSSSSEARVQIPFVAFDGLRPLSLDFTIDRAAFERLTEELRERCCQVIAAAVKDAGFRLGADAPQPWTVERVLLVGGGSRTPALAEAIASYVGRPVASGVNPDHAVALGAALNAGVLKGTVTESLLLDAISAPLGIETGGGIFTRLLESHTTIPTRRAEFFTTQAPEQDTLELRVLEGRVAMAVDAEILARIQLHGLAQKKARRRVMVTFDVDPNEILHVEAKVPGPGGAEVSTSVSYESALVVRRERRTGKYRAFDGLVPVPEGGAKGKTPPPPADKAVKRPRSPRTHRFVFVSYATPDLPYVTKLSDHLEKQGIKVWFARDLGAGSDWPTELQERLACAAAVLVVMTLHADRSRWVKREILFAQDLKKPILPLRLSDYRMFILLDVHDEDVRTGTMPSHAFVDHLAALVRR